MEDFVEWLPLIFGAFIYFIITTCAVKLAVKEALYEVKEDIIKEFNIRKGIEENQNVSDKFSK